MKHVRTLKHLKNDPDQTIQLRRRGRPKTKPSLDETIPPKSRKTKPDPRRRTNNVTRKELLSQAKEYKVKGYAKWNKQQLLSVLSKVKKKLFFKKHDLQQLNKDQLKNIAKENNIKATLKKRKDGIIEAILKTRDCNIREIAASELSFHNDLIEHTKEERNPHTPL